MALRADPPLWQAELDLCSSPRHSPDLTDAQSGKACDTDDGTVDS